MSVAFSQDFVDELFKDYYEACRTSKVPMVPLTPQREKKVIKFFLQILSQSSSEEDKGLVSSAEEGNVEKFETLLRKEKRYKELLYRCANF